KSGKSRSRRAGRGRGERSGRQRRQLQKAVQQSAAADGGRDSGSFEFTVSARPPLLSCNVRRCEINSCIIPFHRLATTVALFARPRCGHLNRKRWARRNARAVAQNFGCSPVLKAPSSSSAGLAKRSADFSPSWRHQFTECRQSKWNGLWRGLTVWI